MILDQPGQLFPEKSIGERYAEALERSRRDTKLSLAAHFYDGWTLEQHRHWVETGERPK